MGSAFIKTEILYRNFVPRRLLVIWGFPALYFGLLTDAKQTCQAVHSLNSKYSRLPIRYFWVMNCENAPKEIAVVCWGRGRRDESREFRRVGAGELSSAADTNNTSFATLPTTKQTIEEIRGSKATSKKPRKSMLHKTISGKSPSKFAIFFHVKPSDFRFVTWFMSFLKFGLPLM